MVLKLHYERPSHIGTWTLNIYAPLDIVNKMYQDVTNTLYLHNKLESGMNHKVSLDETKGDVAKKEADKRQNYTSQELNTTDWVCNARLVRPFLRERLLIVLEGFDIFHQLKNITHTMTSDVITNTRTNVIPSYAMICAVYRMNYKKVSNKQKVHWF